MVPGRGGLGKNRHTGVMFPPRLIPPCVSHACKNEESMAVAGEKGHGRVEGRQKWQRSIRVNLHGVVSQKLTGYYFPAFERRRKQKASHTRSDRFT